MKSLTLSRLLILVGVGLSYSPAFACKSCSKPGTQGLEKTFVNAPAACTLSTSEFSEQEREIDAIFARREEVRELEDGFAFRFPGNEKELAARLARWVITERQCCSFFGFELTFASDQGPIWLTVKGPEAKALVASMMELSISAP